MKNESLTLSESDSRIAELKSNDVRVVEPLPNIPEGVYSGKFNTQKVNNKNEPVIDCIEYTAPDGQKSAFFLVRVNIASSESGKEYQNAGIALTDEIREVVSTGANLAKSYDFKSVKGRRRNFIELAV